MRTRDEGARRLAHPGGCPEAAREGVRLHLDVSDFGLTALPAELG